MQTFIVYVCKTTFILQSQQNRIELVTRPASSWVVLLKSGESGSKSPWLDLLPDTPAPLLGSKTAAVSQWSGGPGMARLAWLERDPELSGVPPDLLLCLHLAMKSTRGKGRESAYLLLSSPPPPPPSPDVDIFNSCSDSCCVDGSRYDSWRLLLLLWRPIDGAYGWQHGMSVCYSSSWECLGVHLRRSQPFRKPMLGLSSRFWRFNWMEWPGLFSISSHGYIGHTYEWDTEPRFIGWRTI